MRDRTERILRIACAGIAALLVYHVVRDVIRGASATRVRIPELPTLAAETNAPAGVAAAGPDTKKGTNAPVHDSARSGTNAVASAKSETNSAPAHGVAIVAAT